MPAVVTPAVIAAISLVPLQANAVDLPDMSAEELMIMMMDAQPTEFSGTILKTSNLGLPALELSSMVSEEDAERMREKMPEEFADFAPEVIEQNLLTEAMELVTGEHRVRVFVGETGMRAQILDMMAQRDLIVSGNTVWTYDSREQVAMYAELDEEKLAEGKVEAEAEISAYIAEIGLDLTDPQAVAEYLMSQVGDSSEVTVGTDHYHAGRTAYQLNVTPNSEVSLVDSIVVSVDSETGMPLALSVYSTEQAEPAMEVGYESISFGDQDESMFSFNPPAGTQIVDLKELEAQKEKVDLEMWMDMEEMESLEEKPEPVMIGEGWDTIVLMPAGDKALAEMGGELIQSLMTPVAGGMLFSTPLMNVFMTDSGDVYAGAVSVQHLLDTAK
jgi:outer membrane lipoprotein-sorting protein